MENIKELSRRDALKVLGVGGSSLLFSSSANASTKLSQPASHKKVRIVIVGGGTGGMIAAARLRRSAPNAQITIIAPNKKHLYQSGQVFVAAGLYDQSDNERETTELLEDKVKWLRESVITFEPDQNRLTTDKSGVVTYDYLVVALGIEYDYEAIDGLSKDMIGKNGIASVYLNDTRTGSANGGNITKKWFDEIKNSAEKERVNILCTEPSTPIKGLGTSLDILFLGNDMIRKKGHVQFFFAKPNTTLFPFDDFNRVLENEVKKQNISPLYKHELTAIDVQKKIATFRVGAITKQIAYDFIHVVPPMHPSKVLQESALAAKDGLHKGYLDVDAKTLQHKKYKNVFGLGDCLGIALGKTGGSAQEQAVVIQDNLAAEIENKKLPMEYNGYTVAPIKVKFGEVLLAEFNTQKALPTFWLNPYKPRWIWWELDLHIMRKAYFSMMMRGMM